MGSRSQIEGRDFGISHYIHIQNGQFGVLQQEYKATQVQR